MILTTWNILASGLADGKFVTPTGDTETTQWNVRRSKILKMLGELLSSGDVVGLQEVDSFFWLLKSLRRSLPDLHGILVLPNEYASSLDPKNETSLLKTNHNRTFGSEGCPIEFAQHRCQLAGTKTNDPLSAKYHSPHGVALLWNSRKLSVTHYVSPTDWHSLGQYEYMTYGYACRRHLTVSTMTKISKKCLLINVAHLKSGSSCASDRSNHMHVILKEMYDYSSSHAAVLLMDTNYNVEHQTDLVLEAYGFISATAPHYNFEMRRYNSTSLNQTGTIKVFSNDKVIVRSSESLLWAIVQPPCSFWTPPADTTSLLRRLVSDTSISPILKYLFKKDNWQSSIMEGVGTGTGGIDLDNAARVASVPTPQLVEALMCLQPNEYAPSDHSPVSMEFISS